MNSLFISISITDNKTNISTGTANITISISVSPAIPQNLPSSLFPQLSGYPLNRPLAVFCRDIWIDALVAQVRDDRP